MNDHDLLISGCGRLGERILLQVLQRSLLLDRVDRSIVCETKTQERHPVLRKYGCLTKTADEAAVRAKSLLIAFPPGENYLEEIKRAMSQWTKEKPGVLISSTGVYEENDGNRVHENSKRNVASVLTAAEDYALENGAHVLRLAGLYDRRNGPQHFWEKKGYVSGSPNAYLNLLHRFDAAQAVHKVLESNRKAGIWNISDNVPITRGEIVSAWFGLRKKKAPLFSTGGKDGFGKKVDSSSFAEVFDWKPRWEGFLDFCQSLEEPRNLLGSVLENCSIDPVTGFQRDGKCQCIEKDPGQHIVCAELTQSFLDFSKNKGNDLSTPQPQWGFSGLKEGDRWCLCANRWLEALASGKACKIHSKSTHEAMLDWVDVEVLKSYCVDLS